ncbi:hypothetical protein K1T71_009315 [Dendrolimus kikuchii]|uniref:Uncharacterized protein n=1 Tax=Dendrolimus kikuchii TaxID=765133 RepID=A0ACC1CU30_9NEOP|nr:hypothetical protein K1T71_009315 [Dendrolimus kikuchii]
MQCIQPFCANGFPTFGQFYNYNQVLFCLSVIPYSNIYPEIIGEGEVISWVSPDGTVQFFFMPTSPYPYNPPKYYPEWNNTNKDAWYIRNYPKQLPENYWFPHFNSYDCNIHNSQYKLKFHNDGWSSTTDLHYFIPRTRPCDLYIPQKCNAITQIEIPVATNAYHYQIVCNKPCNCPRQGLKSNEEIIQCCCGNEGQVSPMAVDTKCDEPTHCVANIVHVKDALKCTSHGDTKTNSDVRCECKEEKRYSNNDKLVTTFAEQGSGCVADVSCETQCCDDPKENTVTKHKVFKLKPIKQEIWQPITPLSKKAMKSKSENLVIKSDNNTGSCSCSDNDII